MVVGAGGGIGSAIARALAARGDRVFLVGRSVDALAAELPDAVAVPIDLRDSSDFPDIEQVDVLVHCAGIAEIATVADTSYELWQDTFTVNVLSAAEITRRLLPELRKSRGQVVFVGAANGMRAVPRWSAYVGSKAALRELADSLREEEPELRVTSIHPGGTATELLRRVRAGFGRPYEPKGLLSPESLAALVVTVLSAPPDAHITDLAVRGAYAG